MEGWREEGGGQMPWPMLRWKPTLPLPHLGAELSLSSPASLPGDLGCLSVS